jgi:hypothetical protein
MTQSGDVVTPSSKTLEWLRYLCAFLLYMYGGSKLAHMQFSLPAEYSKRAIGSLTGYELTWYYYGYSYTYAIILGLIQVLAGSLLLFRKTALAGATLMLPVIANILLINIFILRNDYGPELVALIISVAMLLIIWPERDKFIAVFWSQQPSEPLAAHRKHLWVRALVIASALGLLIFGVVSRRISEHN